MNTSQRIQTGMGLTLAVIGVAGTLAPSLAQNAPGASKKDDQGAGSAPDYLTRLWTLREAALGVILLGTSKSLERRRVLAITSGLAVAEVVVVLRTSTLPQANRWSTAGTASAFAAAGLYAAMRAAG